MQKDFFNKKLYIFDLDNTLIDENEYLFSAYREIANYLSEFTNNSTDEISNMLITEFQKNGRKKLFNKILDKINISNINIKKLLTILRKHQLEKKLSIYPTAYELLQKLQSENKSIFILTNGNPEQQKNKINQTNWQDIIINNIVYANEIEAKPSPKAIFEILKITGIEKENTILIGDSNSDKLCALNAGIEFYRFYY